MEFFFTTSKCKCTFVYSFLSLFVIFSKPCTHTNCINYCLHLVLGDTAILYQYYNLQWSRNLYPKEVIINELHTCSNIQDINEFFMQRLVHIGTYFVTVLFITSFNCVLYMWQHFTRNSTILYLLHLSCIIPYRLILDSALQ